MYNNESAALTKIIGGTASTTAGVALLPATSGNSLGLILAYGAIGIGIVVIASQIIVRVLRTYYRARSK